MTEPSARGAGTDGAPSSGKSGNDPPPIFKIPLKLRRLRMTSARVVRTLGRPRGTFIARSSETRFDFNGRVGVQAR